RGPPGARPGGRGGGHGVSPFLSGGWGWAARVAAGAFALARAGLRVPPLDSLELPHLRAAIGAVGAELTAGGAGGPLAAESLANVLAVQLIRHVRAPRRPGRGRDGVLPQWRPPPGPAGIGEHPHGRPP